MSAMLLTLVIPQCSSLRASEEVSFVLPMKLRFVDSEAGFYWHYNSSRTPVEWASSASGGCVFLLRARPGEEWFGVE